MASTTSTEQLHRYSVSFPGYRSGMFTMGYAVSVDAADDAGAIEEAKRIAAEKGFAREATGRPTVRRLYDWAITLRGRDKRRRETFHVTASDEKQALKQLRWNTAAQRFADVRAKDNANILKIEQGA